MTTKKKRKEYTCEGKDCIVCFVALTEENSKKSDVKRGNFLCTRCSRARNNRKYANRKEIIREQQRQYDLSRKKKVVEAYGGKCTCCGETIEEFLTIDHIKDNGAQERKEFKQGSGCKMYRWLIKNNFPKDNYQLLCYNCNCAKGFFGYCPHQKDQILAGINALKASVFEASTSESAPENSEAPRLS